MYDYNNLLISDTAPGFDIFDTVVICKTCKSRTSALYVYYKNLKDFNCQKCHEIIQGINEL